MYGARKFHWMPACKIKAAAGVAYLALLSALVAAALVAAHLGQAVYRDAQVPSAALKGSFSASSLLTAASQYSSRLLKGSDVVSVQQDAVSATASVKPDAVDTNVSIFSTLGATASSPSSSISGNLSYSASNSNDAAATAAAALQPLSASDLGHAVESPLIPAVQYYYKTVNGSETMPLGLPVHYTPGLDLTRWVLSAWSISRQSAFRAPAGLVDSTMQRVEQLINNFTRMSPGQVQLIATANVTVPYVFKGIGQWTGDATEAMRKCASAAAGGYDPAYITVLLDPPDFGVKTEAFLNSKAASVASVYRQKKVVYYPTDSGSRQRYSRKLLQHGSPLATSNSSSTAPWASDSSVKEGKTSNDSQWTHVWVSYHRLDPLNVTILLQSLSAACGAVDLVQAADMTATRCGQYTQQWLQQAGMQIDSNNYVEYLQNIPMVSVSVRLAVGVTQQQAESNTDTLIAMWLAQPRNIAGAINASGLPDPIGPDSLIKWIVTPQIWGAEKPPGSARPPGNPAGLPPGTIAGISVGCAAFAALACGLIMYFIDRRNKRLRLEDKTDAESSASSRRRRRRRHTKPRYLLPDPPPPTEATTSSTAEAVEASQQEDSDDLSPDQIRPAMKELGDSVTSAARFELEEPDADNSGEQGATNPQGDRLEPGPAHGGGNRVLAARRALVLERQATGSPGTDGVADGTVSVEDLTSSRGGWLPSGNEGGSTTNHPIDVGAFGALSPSANNVTDQGPTEEVPPSHGVPVDAMAAGYVDQHTKAGLRSIVKPNGVSIAQQQEPWTPPQPLQPSPELESASTMSSTTSPTTLVVVGSPSSKPLSNGIGALSSKSNRSPFVRSYDMSQLASAVPDLDAGRAVAGGGCNLAPHDGSHSGLHGIDSTQISVLPNGQVSVLGG